MNIKSKLNNIYMLTLSNVFFRFEYTTDEVDKISEQFTDQFTY